MLLELMKTHLLISLVLILGMSACTARRSGNSDAAANGADPKKFIDEVNESLLKLNIEGSQAGWVSETYITDDTSALNARSNQRVIEATERFAKDAVRFDKVETKPDLRRELDLLKVSLVMATPSDPKESEAISRNAANLNAEHGKRK